MSPWLHDILAVLSAVQRIRAEPLALCLCRAACAMDGSVLFFDLLHLGEARQQRSAASCIPDCWDGYDSAACRYMDVFNLPLQDPCAHRWTVLHLGVSFLPRGISGWDILMDVGLLVAILIQLRPAKPADS